MLNQRSKICPTAVGELHILIQTASRSYFDEAQVPRWLTWTAFMTIGSFMRRQFNWLRTNTMLLPVAN
jgi:hypothetical protein